MTARGPPLASWESLLRTAISTPGLINAAYTQFHRYSVRNQLLAMAQCVARDIKPGPLATYKEWERLGRHVTRGEKALILCMPITPATEKEAEPEEETTDAAHRQWFVYRARWFALAQTDGEAYQPLALPEWTEERALTTLGIQRIPFEHLDGNTQGYATAEGIAVNPVAALPHKTLFHELAHVLLGHRKGDTLPRAVREVEAEGVALLCCEALGLDGAVYARGYLQHWLNDGELTDAMAQRIITTAQRTINAGREPGAETAHLNG